MPHDGLTIDQRFFPVPEDLTGCLTTIVRIDIGLDEGVRIADHMQPEWASIRFIDGTPPEVTAADGTLLCGASAVATGASSAPTRYITGKVRLWGIGFLPLGWARLVERDASDFSNRAVDIRKEPAFAGFVPLAEKLFGQNHDDEAEYSTIVSQLRTIDQARGNPGPRQLRNWERIGAAHNALLNAEISDVGEFAEEAGLTIRTLERLCRSCFGFTPAKLLRRQRLMRSLTQYMMSPDRTWGEVIDANYHDQAHFVREFHAFMDMSPTEYAALESPILDALITERAKMLGAAAQTLQPAGNKAKP